MRTLLIGALAAALAGCTCLLPPQARIDGCTDEGFACFDRTAARQPIEPEPESFKASSATIKLKSTIAEKMKKPSSAHARAHLAMKTAKPAVIAASAEPSASGQPAETSDPVIIKAKTTIAAQLKNPASAEFVEMKRAIRKNMVGEPVDTICGRVKARNTADEEAGNRPFLYFVKDDHGFVVYGPAGSAAETAYRNICTSQKPQNATQTGP
jgi:hypothetical protein